MAYAPTNLVIAFVALLIERIFGYPKFLQDRIYHPVVWIGALINALDKHLNVPQWAPFDRKMRGVLALMIVITATLSITLPLAYLLRSFTGGGIVEALLASTLISQKELYLRVRNVADGLDRSLEDGRKAVSHLVGRDPDHLNKSEITRGAIESLAENTSDGIVAPLFWLLIGGLPVIALYKAINTADSMIGYRSDKYNEFGWASARLDDLVNLPAARLTGLLYAAAAYLQDKSSGRKSFTTMLRDAPKHTSPNAGWPEAAIAGALDIRLGGTRSYQGRTVKLPDMGSGRSDLLTTDIHQALGLYKILLNVLLGTLAALLIAIILLASFLPNQ